MPFHPTPIPGAILFDPKVWEDPRGHFFESYNARAFAQAGIRVDFVQDNQARSTYGVLRGLHYQTGASAQAKLVRVLNGEVLDVIVDLRPDSATYGQAYSVLLSAENRRQLFVPRGMAHGYAVLSPYADFFYKCDNYYDRASEGGIRYDDAALGIDWQLPAEAIVVSEKDAGLPAFGAHRT